MTHDLNNQNGYFKDSDDAALEQELDQYLNNLADEIIAEEQFQRDARAAGNR